MTLHNRFKQLAALINVDVKLVVDEKLALQGRTHARGRAERRAFACTNGKTVWVRPKLLGADAQRRDGVLMHELAHCWCIQNGHAEHTESECDAVAKELFGATIRYDDDDVQTIGEGVTPRPAYLPNPTPVWFHGGSVDDVAQVKALGHFPADYAPVRGNFGSGVYLTSSKTEAKKFGDVVIAASVHPAVKLLDMRDPTYRAMPSTVFDHLVSARAKTAFEVRWQESDLPGAIVAGATADGYDGLIWKGDAWNDWAVVFDPTQVLLASKPRKARANPDDYRGSHKPSGRDYGAPLHDVEVMMPDYYAHPEWYPAWPGAMDKAAARTILGARGKPGKLVVVYRAVPLDVQSINPGDWVTTVKAYAQAHMMNALNGRGHILSTTAAARDLFTSGDSHLEWGWHPEAVENPAPELVQSDLEDAIQHADLYGDQGWTLDDFNIKYLGELPLGRLNRIDDWSGWIDVDPKDFEGLSTEERLAQLESFRGPAWAQRAASWLKHGVPPVVVIAAPMEVDYELYEQIGDGRGRVNFALAMGLKKLPVVRMVWKHKLAPKPT